MVYFKDSEYQNKSKCDPIAIATLESFRNDLGFPITLTADACTDGHASDSWHYKGKAFDGVTEAPLWDFIFKAQKAGFRGIGIYVKDGKVQYFHVDIRNTAPTFWVCEVPSNYIYKLGK